MWKNIMSVLFVISITTTARTEELKKVELEAGLGLGGPIGMIGSEKNTAYTFTANVFGRIGSPRFVWTRLEINAVPAHGLGANFVLDLVRTKKLTIHILDPGIFWNIGDNPISLTDLPRKIDLTVGAGFDYRFKAFSTPLKNNFVSLGLNWRAYLGKPLDTIMVYGNYAKLIFIEHLKGAQLCLNASFIW